MSTKYATLPIRKELEQKVASMEQIKADPLWNSTGTVKKQEFEKQLKADKQKLEEITPPPVTDRERQRLEFRAHQLEQALVHGDPSKRKLDGMNTEMEMQKAPTGATGRQLSWDHMSKHYTCDPDGTIRPKKPSEQGMVWEWKDIQRCLGQDREEFDPDIANVDRLRPKVGAGSSGLMDYPKRSYAPNANLSWEEIESMFGTEGLSKLAKMVMESEKAGTARAPLPEEIIAQPNQPVSRPTHPDVAFPIRNAEEQGDVDRLEELARMRRDKLLAWRQGQEPCGAVKADGTICPRPRGRGMDSCGIKGHSPTEEPEVERGQE